MSGDSVTAQVMSTKGVQQSNASLGRLARAIDASCFVDDIFCFARERSPFPVDSRWHQRSQWDYHSS